MKTHYKNKPLHLFQLIFAVLLLAIFSGCNSSGEDDNKQDTNKSTVTTQVGSENSQSEQKNAQQKPDTIKNESAFNWLKLSGWHTQGIVSRDSPIRIVFNRDVVSDELVGKDASNVMYISPAIKGKPVFKSKSEIIWVPKERLQAGTEYKVSIKPTDLKDVPQKTLPFQFSFHVIPLEYEVKTYGITPLPNQSNLMQLEGQILISDRVSPEKVEKVLKAESQGKSLPIQWIHDKNGKKHRFIINNIVRETFATDVNLSWDGTPINVNTKNKKQIRVPALNEFKITNIQVVHSANSNPYIQIRFSDELDTAQNIKGLVVLAKSKYKTRIDKNIVNIYPNKNLSGGYTVRINKGIKSATGKILDKPSKKEVFFDDTKPQVRFVGNGSILPENSTLEIPFEAVGVNAVEVTAFEIYPDNMGQFLQVNRLSGDYETGRTGRYLWKKTIPLTPADENKWNRYSFNVTELMKKHHGGLLRLTLTIKRRYSTYNCPANSPPIETRPTLLKNMEDNNVKEPSGWDGISDYVEETNDYDYDWDQRNNPCTDSYFTFNRDKTRVSQNFIASNIGLITKRDAQGNLNIISTDLRTAEPLTGVELEVRNFQGQTIGKAKSDGSGFAKINTTKTPFLLVAKKFDDTAYLKLNAKTALAVSHFDVSGQKVKQGIKGIIYGERGVWRPGDNIYLSFVMQDKSGKIPEKHPVTMKLIDPQGQVIKTKTSTDSVGGFYAFKFKTDEKAVTGRWMAKAFLGGSTFSKALMIETVRPNRLKIELDFETDQDTKTKDPVLYGKDQTGKNKNIKGTLFSQWLHGATASNLKADISVRYTKKRTTFDSYSDYTFDDPSRRLESQENKILEGRLDDKGYLKFEKDIQPKGNAAGMLLAHFTSRVFEKGGAFSISTQNVKYHPYANYVGLKLPKGDKTRGMLLTDKVHTVKIASLNAKGKKTSLDRVKVSLYKIGWKWWWDRSADSLAKYIDGEHRNLLKESTIKTINGEGSWNFEIKYPEWGRYLVRACDLTGQHCAAKIVYIDWPGWAGRAQEEGSGAANRLNLFSDKTAYTVGEEALIQLPKASQGRALLTIETGSQILDQRWIDLNKIANSDDNSDKDKTKDQASGSEQDKIQVKVPITAAMSPNAYVHISLLQPHKDKNNDRPLRMYGIIPLEVSDPATYLKPAISVDKEWKPESKQTITVNETSGKPMNYTLAVVDEGLLGLTAFKTPNLHRYFYSKEALGIKTWDLFDEVIGAYSGKLERMLALGGGEEAEVDNEDSKKRRFPPVVKFMGPFHLEADKTATHEITLPPYLGAVRVMLVAGEKGAYGKAQQSVFVRQALMLQASMPRVLGSGEEVSVPVALFAMDDTVKDVEISVKTDDLIQVIGDPTSHISFTETGEKVGFITLKASNKEGKAHVHFSATSGKHKSESDIYIDIRRANQETSRVYSKVLDPETSWENKLEPFGLKGTNQSVLEISSVPSLNLEKRLGYLIRYPHGCLEQTTSSVFPQLFLDNVMALDKKKQAKAQHHINKGIERLLRFKQPSGDFSYWPGMSGKTNPWASIYAGNFLIEAKNKGYSLPSGLLDNWLDFQRNEAQAYFSGSKKYSHIQAYRLYVLALAGQPQLGAMNRLLEDKKLNNKARWLLASAYQKASQPDAAKRLIQGLVPGVEPVNQVDRTFSSTLGDLGLQLESLVTLNKKQDANKLLEQIADEMGGNKYQNTQGIAWALMAVSHYLGGDTKNFSAVFTENGKARKIESDKAISSINVSTPDAQVSLKNTSGVRLFATLVSKGVPIAGDEQSIASGLNLNVSYEVRDKQNAQQWNSMKNQTLPQGSDVRITVVVTNNSKHQAENIALTIPVAAGMEIASNTEQTLTKDSYDYRDIRDDRIYYYFPLKKGESKVFAILTNASYKGRYYLPAIHVEAMYDGKLKARQKGQWINIVNEVDDTNNTTNDTGKNNQQQDDKAESKLIGTTATIRSLRAWLYDSATEKSRTNMYLIIGDKVKVLKEAKGENNSDWLFIHFEGKKTLEKWIRKETIE